MMEEKLKEDRMAEEKAMEPKNLHINPQHARKFPGGFENQNGYDINGSKVIKNFDPKTEKYNLF